MTRLRIAALFVAVVAGDYAALMLIGGQLMDFVIAAAICAGASVAAGLIAYADDEDARRQHELGRVRRKAVAPGRVAVRGRRNQAATAPERQCPLCGVARETLSDSPRFADRQGARSCRECASAPNPEPTRGPAAGLKAGSDGQEPKPTRRGNVSARMRGPGPVRWRRSTDDSGVEVLT